MTPANTTNTPWYTQTWFTMVMLFVFAPIGCFLLWKFRGWNVVTKALVTAVFLIAFIDALASKQSPAPTVASTTSAKPINSAPASLPKKTPVKRVELKKQTRLCNVGAIFGKSYRQVNRIIGGKPIDFDTVIHAPGEVYGLPGGAVERTYTSDGHVPLTSGATELTVDFDKDGRAAIVSIGPISGYSLSDWRTLLTHLGLPDQPEPDSPGSAGMTWNSPAPYHIVMMEESPGEIMITEIMPRKIQDIGEKQP